ncbi:MAG: recombination-associated protein RdgC [Deltaproteobacteria bacterium]|nr:recombination-associated protein RdgC [Deltaproteobacteria bacterium]
MGLLSGSAGFCRYQVLGELPEVFWDFVDKKIKAYSFQDIDGSADEMSAGWVGLGNMFDREFSYANYSRGAYVTFSLRLDTRTVPAALFKRHVEAEINEKLRQEERKRLSKREKEEIKEKVKLDLLTKTMPVPAVFDILWNYQEAWLLLFCLRNQVRKIIEELFRQTFDLTLQPMTPGQLALNMAAAQLADGGLDDLSQDVYSTATREE